MARVTNLAKSPRGFATSSGHHVMLAPGETADIDVPVSHPAHDAWVAVGHATIVHAEIEPAVEPQTEPQETKNVGKRKRSADIG